MPPRQRSKSPRSAPIVSGSQPSGTPGAAETSKPARDAAVLGSDFDATSLDEASTSSFDHDAAPRATFVGEELTYKDRRARIAEAAYWRAEQRGFAPGHELEDWLAAEQTIDALLGSESGRKTPDTAS